MDLSITHYIGMEITGARGNLTCAILDDSHRILFRGELTFDEFQQKLNESSVAIAAITSPITLNEGLMANPASQPTLFEPRQTKRYANIRLCEYELFSRGFTATRTPSNLDQCTPALQRALRFSSEMAALGFQRWPSPGAEKQVMEVHPDAAYAALLGSKLNSPKSLEGRLQRQLLLQEEHLNVRDPMTFFEEITRHKIKTGQLPEGIVYSAAELNALIAALTARCAYKNPTGVTLLGDVNEGRIVLPISSNNR